MSMRRTSQNVLRELAYEPLLKRVLARVAEADLRPIADELAARDPYGEASLMTQALRRIVPDCSASVAAALEHQLWCAWREAHYQSGAWVAPAAAVEIVVEGKAHVDETAGRPTLLVAPMTLCTSDAIRAVRHLLPGRRTIFYGEDMAADDRRLAGAELAGGGLAGARRIHRALAGGAVLCTYPDFVYAGHPICSVKLFGVPRPMSAGFASLAAREGVMLLPGMLIREPGRLRISIDEPLQIAVAGARRALEQAAAELLAELLEGQIRKAPQQWLLASTLSFESPQAAR